MSQATDAVEQIRQQIDDDVLTEAEQADVDVDGVIESVAEEREQYGIGTQTRFAQAELNRQIEAADSETIKGILMGCRDRFGRNWPRRYSLVRSNGEHIELSSWEGTLPGPKGNDVELAPGAVAAIGADYNDEYEDWQAERVESLTPLDKPELMDRLKTIAKRPSDLSRSDEYETDVVTGEIAFVNPQTVFRNGEPQGDGPVMMDDDREPPQKQPHFEVALSDDGGTRVRGHLERQRYGEPHVDLPEIEMLLQDAQDAGSPESQASFLQAALEGLEVVMVGNVSSVDTTRDDDGNKRTYVDVACTAIVAGERSGEATAEGMADTDGESDTESEQADADDDAGEPEAQPSPDDSEPAQTGVSADVEDVADDIATAARLQGAVPEDLTLADVKEMAPELADDHPDEVLTHAVKSLSDDDADGGGDEESESAAEGGAQGMDALEAVKDGGVHKCPADDCLAQIGETSAFMSHVEDEHADGPAPEWVAEQVGA